MPAATKLDDSRVQELLKTLTGWELNEGTITKLYKLKDFLEAMALVNRVADLAEGMDHHPDILIRYNKVTLTLVTHSAGGLTEKDFRLARQIDTPSEPLLMEVLHDEPQHRFVLPLEGGNEAVLLYRKEGDTLDFYHTYVPEKSREKGLAEKVVEAGFHYAQKQGLKVIPSCPYISGWFLRKRKEFLPLT